MRISIFIPLIIVVLLATTGCKRDNLFYSVDDTAIIRVTVNWEKSKLSPNGVSAWVYDDNGKIYEKLPPFSNCKFFDLGLPEGKYKILVFNNSIYEHSKFLTIIKTESIYDVTAFLNEKSRLSKSGKNYSIVSEPDTVAIANISDVVITREMVDYFKDKPTLNKPIITKEYKVTPERKTTLINLKVNVKGLKYAATAPQCLFYNAVRGHKMGINKNDSILALNSFVLNNRMFEDENKVNGTLSKIFNSFGLHENKDIKYLIDMNFTLIDGQEYPLTVDVTPFIRMDYSYQPRMFIEIDIELPQVIGTEGNGAFDSDVEEWEEIYENIPMKYKNNL